MVLMHTMAECERGEHDKCPKQHPAPPGEFGGEICDCPCHDSGRAALPPTDVDVELKKLADSDAFERYLKEHPDGPYADLARRGLTRKKDR